MQNICWTSKAGQAARALVTAVSAPYPLTLNLFLGLLTLGALPLPWSAQGATIGSWPGFERAYPGRVEVVANRAYVTMGNAGLGIFDLSEPAQPVRLGGYNTPGSAYGLKVIGNYAYVTVGSEGGLVVVDVSNPANPVRVGGLDTLGSAPAFDVANGYAFVADGEAGLQVVDVTDPARPTWVADYASGINTYGVTVAGQYAYLVNLASLVNASVYSLIILDVSDPTHPVQVGVMNTSGYVGKVKVVGNRAYLVLRSEWQVVDVSNPVAPTLLSTVSARSSVSDIHVVGSRAYVIDGGDLRSFDVTDPTAVNEGQAYATPDYSSSVTVSGTNAYVTGGETGVWVLNVANPAAPVAVTNFAEFASAQAVELAGPHAYVADGRGGLQIIDVSQPESPVRVGNISFPVPAADVALLGHYAHVAAGSMRIIDVANPARPVEVGNYGGSVRRVQIRENLAYLVGDFNGLQIFNVSDPTQPQLVSFYSLPSPTAALHVAGNYAYVVRQWGNNDLNIINVSDPANPVRVGGYGLNNQIADVQVMGSRAYLAVQRWTGSNYFRGLEILDVTLPASPVLIGSLDTGFAPTRLRLTDNLVHLCHDYAGVLTVDVSNPANPLCVGGFDTEGQATHVAVAGNHAYVADGSFGLTIATPPMNGFPFIVWPPLTQTALAGATVAFAVEAQCGPLNYQWRFNGTDVPGANSNRLVLANVFTNQAGAYSVVVSNPHGAVTSAVASLLVQLRAPTLTNSTAPINLLAGDAFGFCATVSGAPPPRLQWLFNGLPIANANDACFSLNRATTNQSGDYTLVASNVAGVVTGAAIPVSIRHEKPFITVAISNQTVLAGVDVTLCAPAIGGPRPTVQWQFAGVNLAGQTNSCLTMVAVETNRSGRYTLVASNLVGVTTADMTVTVIHRSPEFNLHPFSQFLVEGADGSLLARAAAGPPANYYLLFNGTNVAVPYTFSPFFIPNAPPPAADFSLLEVAAGDAGRYQIVASNLVGMATSQVATVFVTPAGPLDRWTQRNPLPQSQPILAITHSDGLFVGVGERGVIVTSTNGVDWATQRRRVDVALRDVTWGQGQFIAVGDGGVILGSADGTNWTHRLATPPATQYNPNLGRLYGVTYGQGTFVAIGYDSPSAFTSPDGYSWQQGYVGGASHLSSVAFGANTFVAVGIGVFTSPDGQAWTPQAGPEGYPEHVSFVNDRFVAVGVGGLISVSTDATLWTSRNLTRRLLDVTYGNGTYVTVGTRGTLLTSTDSLTWTAGVSGTPDRLEAITFAAGQFVAAGENGTTITSTDAAAWTKRSLGTTLDLDGMVVAKGTIVVVGKAGAILRSTDGSHFTEVPSGTTNNLHGIGWANGLFVAVGEPGEILTSPDAVHWTRRESGSTNSLKAVTYSPGIGQWVAVGTQATILTSPDAVVWTPQAIPYPYLDLNAVAWGNGTFVVGGDGPGGDGGSLHRSVDGINWILIADGGKNVRGVTFGNGLFLAAANDGQLLVSSNGLTWSGLYSGLSLEGQNLRSAHFAQGVWTVVGNGGILLTSTNLFNWTRRPSRVFENLHGAGYLNGKLVVIGNRGTILQSDRFLAELETPVFAAGPGLRLPFQGVINRTYQIQASSDLVNWTNLLTFTNLAERSEFTDPNAWQYLGRFYRLVEP